MQMVSGYSGIIWLKWEAPKKEEQNPKSEIRNPKEIRMTNDECAEGSAGFQPAVSQAFQPADLAPAL
jgi:hypothetical protein